MPGAGTGARAPEGGADDEDAMLPRSSNTSNSPESEDSAAGVRSFSGHDCPKFLLSGSEVQLLLFLKEKHKLRQLCF